MVKKSRIVVVQYVKPSVEWSATDGLALFDLFNGCNLLVVVRRSVYIVQGHAATRLLERLVGMNTFGTKGPPSAGPVPADLVYPAQWAYDRPAFVSVYNPSTVLLLRMDFRQTYRCHFENLGLKRTTSTAGTDPLIVAKQINNIMRRVPKQTLRVNDTDREPMVFLNFMGEYSSVELRV